MHASTVAPSSDGAIARGHPVGQFDQISPWFSCLTLPHRVDPRAGLNDEDPNALEQWIRSTAALAQPGDTSVRDQRTERSA